MITRMFKKVWRLPLHFQRWYKIRSTLAQLKSHNCTKVKAIGHAIYEALNDKTPLEEQHLINLIEQRRASLLHSDKEIIVVDYGVGVPDLNRTSEEMERGVQSTSLVKNICEASIYPFWALLLYKLIRKLEPLSCVELGSCVGISASYISTALKINGNGHLYTLEGSPEIAKTAEETLDSLDLKNAAVIVGPFQKTLKSILESSKPVDFFFNDGHHDHDAVLRYFNESLPYLSDGAVIIFDDISWSSGMRKAWTEIENDRRVTASIDLTTMGIALIDSSLTTKLIMRIPL
jgi:predicted O-methyltransferase YrrM